MVISWLCLYQNEWDVIIRFHETRLSTSSKVLWYMFTTNHKRHIAINNSEHCLLCECDDVLISGISKKYFVQMVDIECRLSNWCMNHIHYWLYRCRWGRYRTGVWFICITRSTNVTNISYTRQHISDTKQHSGARVAQWVRSLDLTAHTSLSPIRRGFAPSFVNYKKGALDSQSQVI